MTTAKKMIGSHVSSNRGRSPDLVSAASGPRLMWNGRHACTACPTRDAFLVTLSAGGGSGWPF